MIGASDCQVNSRNSKVGRICHNQSLEFPPTPPEVDSTGRGKGPSSLSEEQRKTLKTFQIQNEDSDKARERNIDAMKYRSLKSSTMNFPMQLYFQSIDQSLDAGTKRLEERLKSLKANWRETNLPLPKSDHSAISSNNCCGKHCTSHPIDQADRRPTRRVQDLKVAPAGPPCTCRIEARPTMDVRKLGCE